MMIKTLAHYFQSLNQLQHIIFSCYIKRDYFSQPQQYENKIHQARTKVLGVMKKLRVMLMQDQQALTILESGYEVFFSLNSLKLRISDHATFEVCENEIKKITQRVTAILLAIATHASEEHVSALIESLSEAINGFEELYRSALQVVSYEPIVFLFFIQNLAALRDTLHDFSQRFL